MLRRVITVVSTVSTLVLAGAGAAVADPGWGGVECGRVDYAGCRLGAGHGGQSGQPPAQSGGAGHRGGSDGVSPPPPRGDRIVGDPNLADCHYLRSDYHPPSGGSTTIAYQRPGLGGAITVSPVGYRPAASGSQVRLGRQPQPQPAPGPPGAWYVWRCSGQGWRDALYRPPIWIPDGRVAALSPDQVAAQAYNQLRLPSPQIHASPAATQLVNLPTWLWLDQGQWGPRTATASVPGVAVTATATPQSVTWSMGEGSTVRCVCAGSPFPVGADPRSVSPDCGYTYHRASRGQPNNAYPVSATVHWTVTWSGAGQAGAFPDLTTTSRASFPVVESQAVNSPN